MSSNKSVEVGAGDKDTAAEADDSDLAPGYEIP